MKDDELITIENAEEAAIEAIKKYREIGRPVDAIFWGHILRLLKQKWSQKNVENIFKNIA